MGVALRTLSIASDRNGKTDDTRMAAVVDDSRQHHCPSRIYPFHPCSWICRQESPLVTSSRLAILLHRCLHGLEAFATWFDLCGCVDGLHAGMVNSDCIRPKDHFFPIELPKDRNSRCLADGCCVHRVYSLASNLESNDSKQRSRGCNGLSDRRSSISKRALFFGQRHDSLCERCIRFLDVLSRGTCKHRRTV